MTQQEYEIFREAEIEKIYESAQKSFERSGLSFHVIPSLSFPEKVEDYIRMKETPREDVELPPPPTEAINI